MFNCKNLLLIDLYIGDEDKGRFLGWRKIILGENLDFLEEMRSNGYKKLKIFI